MRRLHYRRENYIRKDKVNGKIHNAFMSALITETKRESRRYEWKLNDRSHSLHCPAFRGGSISNSTVIIPYCWYLYGMKHRIDGSSYLRRNGIKDWHILGIRMTEIYEEMI